MYLENIYNKKKKNGDQNDRTPNKVFELKNYSLNIHIMNFKNKNDNKGTKFKLPIIKKKNQMS